jgi:hypothetical protein
MQSIGAAESTIRFPFRRERALEKGSGDELKVNEAVESLVSTQANKTAALNFYNVALDESEVISEEPYAKTMDEGVGKRSKLSNFKMIDSSLVQMQKDVWVAGILE